MDYSPDFCRFHSFCACFLKRFCGLQRNLCMTGRMIWTIFYETDITKGALMKKINANGFTLIELMIVVVVIAVLAAIAIPAYQNYVEQARRADAKAGLLSLQLAQEKFRANCPSYATNIGTGNNCLTSTLNHDSDSPDDYYQLTIPAATASSYTLAATRDPADKQANDTKCGDFGINQNNEQTVTGSLSVNDCWQR